MAQPRRAAAAPPSGAAPTTGAATAVGASRATLNATVVPGEPFFFEYGLDTTYRQSTQAAEPDGGRALAKLEGLIAGTLYHYRVVQGATVGADRTFRTQPESRTGPPVAPPPIAAAPVGGIISGAPFAAAGAAALVVGAKAQREMAATTVKGILAVLGTIAGRRKPLIEQQVFAAYPGADIAAALAEEERRETVFRKRVEQRVRASMALARKAGDASQRAAVIESMLKRERRFSEQRSKASAERVLAAAELQDTKQRSPQGAFWALGFRKEHTPDCVAMAGKFWPWAVLDEVHPLLHVGCGCRLYTLGEALQKGLMSAGDIMDDATALKLAAPVIKHVREDKAAAHAKYGPMQEADDLDVGATEELLARVGLLEYVAPVRLVATPLNCDATIPPSLVEAEANPDGAMVALFPSPATAKALALPGGEKAEQLHVTLAFLGKAKGIDGEAAAKAVKEWAARTPKLEGEVSGVGHFDLGAGEVCTYRSIDLPDLPGPREKLVAALKTAGTPAKTDHGFTPHMTLDYAMRRPKVEKSAIAFDSVALVLGGERQDFPLTGLRRKR